MTQSDKGRKWKTHFDTWKASGLNVAVWYQKHDMNAHQMYYWIQKFEGDSPSFEQAALETSWLPVQIDYSTGTGEGESPVFIRFNSISLIINEMIRVRK